MSMNAKKFEDAGIALIPIVLAFGAGVATMGIAGDLQADGRVQSAEVAAAAAYDDAERARRTAHYAVRRAADCVRELEEAAARRPLPRLAPMAILAESVLAEVSR